MFRFFIDILQYGGLPFLFLIMLLEGNPIIGSFIPGQTIVIFIGFLISTTKIYNLYATLLIVFIGTLIGDIMGYFIGKKYGIKGLKKFGLNKDSKVYKSSYYFFKKYGLFSIIIGRQINFTRAFMPFFAGCFKMPFFSFLIFATISCLLWTILSVYLGYYFGFIIIDNLNFIMEFIVFALIYLFVVIFGYKNIKNVYHDNFSIIKRYSIHNIIFIGIISIVLIIMGYIFKWGFFQLLNDAFIFIYISGFYLVFGFLLSKYFLSIIFFFILLSFIYLKQVRLLVVYLWGIFISFLTTIILFVFFKIWYNIKIDFRIVGFTILLFFLWILMRKFIQIKKFQSSKKIILYSNLFIVFLIILMFLSNFSLNQNLFLTFFSFLIGVFNSELILLLSHYYIIDNSLSQTRFDL